MIRYNHLRIVIAAGEAKSGGLLGANLSPYLYSVNMLDFCKRFNEISVRDYDAGVDLSVHIICDVQLKLYEFKICGILMSDLISSFLDQGVRLLDLVEFLGLVDFYKSEKGVADWFAFRDLLVRISVQLDGFFFFLSLGVVRYCFFYLYYGSIFFEDVDDFDLLFVFFSFIFFEKKFLC